MCILLSSEHPVSIKYGQYKKKSSATQCFKGASCYQEQLPCCSVIKERIIIRKVWSVAWQCVEASALQWGIFELRDLQKGLINLPMVEACWPFNLTCLLCRQQLLLASCLLYGIMEQERNWSLLFFEEDSYTYPDRTWFQISASLLWLAVVKHRQLYGRTETVEVDSLHEGGEHVWESRWHKTWVNRMEDWGKILFWEKGGNCSVVEVTEIKYGCYCSGWKWFKGEVKRGGDKCSPSNRRSKVEGVGLPRQGDWDVRDLSTGN